jgi:hypothetical protein
VKQEMRPYIRNKQNPFGFNANHTMKTPLSRIAQNINARRQGAKFLFCRAVTLHYYKQCPKRLQAKA